MRKALSFILFVSIALGQSASYSPKTFVQSANSASVDAFGRWRMSTPVTLFDAQNEYMSGDLWWNHDLTAGADTNFAFNGQPVVDLVVPVTYNARVIRQTKEYFRYQSGNSLLIVLTCNPLSNNGATKQGSFKTFGYGDSLNGIFFRFQDDSMAVIKRSNATGSIVDSIVYQANFNVDKLDGTGASGFTILPYRANVFFIDIAWLGVSRARMGVIDAGGNYIVCHQWYNANNNLGVYMRTANLPVRYELRNSAGSADTLRTICATVKSEAGDNNLAGLNQSVTFSYVPKTKTTAFTPILSIRLDTATFNALVNRAQIKDVALAISSATATTQWQLIYDATLTGATWRAMATYTGANPTRISAVQYDTSATAYSGGVVLASGYVAASGVGGNATSSAVAASILSKLPMHNGIKGNTSVPLVIVVRGVSAAPTVHATFNWREIY